MKNLKHALLSLFTLIFSIGIFSTQVLAINTGGVNILPGNPDPSNPLTGSWFIYDVVQPGTEIQDRIKVTNTGSAPQGVHIEARDGNMGSDGSFGFLEKDKGVDIGTWVELEKSDLIIPPNSEEFVNFKIKVPGDAAPGDHVGGFIMSKVDQDKPDDVVRVGGSTVNIVTLVGVRMYMTVAGEQVRGFKVKSAKLGGKSDKMTVNLNIENKGNVRANYQFDAKIYSLFGLYDKAENVQLGVVLPKKNLNTQTIWPGRKDKPLFGPYLSKITVKDTQELKDSQPPKSITRWTFTFYFPVLPIAIMLLGLFLIWFLLQSLRWSKLKRLASSPITVVKPKNDVTLVSIARDYAMDWKTLAALNGIKSPYHVEAGRAIYVPDPGGEFITVPMPSFIAAVFKPLSRLFSKTFKKGPKVDKEEFEILIADKGDTIADFVTFSGVSATEIVRINNLKAPYRLHEGQEILIPKAKRPALKPKPAIKRVTSKVRPVTKKATKTVKKPATKPTRTVKIKVIKPKPRNSSKATLKKNNQRKK